MKGNDFFFPLIPVILFVILVMPLKDSLVDDTFIHLQYARNLVEAGELSFNRGDPTYGATSPLWIFMLAVVYRLGGDILVWCRVLSWAFAFGSIILLYQLVLLMCGQRFTAISAALVLSSEAWFLRWSAVGMETPLAVFMVLAVLTVSCSALRSPGRSALLGLVLFLAVLARPEALLLAPLILLAFVSIRGRRSTKRWLWLSIFLPMLAVWLAIIKGHTGSFFPLTAGAKRGMNVISAEILKHALVPVKIMAATLFLPWLAIIAGIVLGLVMDRSVVSFFRGVGDAEEDAGARIDQGGSGGGKRSRNEGMGEVDYSMTAREGVLLALMWIFALPAVYVIFDFQVLSRYLVPVIPAVIALGITGIRGIAFRFLLSPTLKRLVFILFTLLVIFQSIFFYSHVVVYPTQGFSRGLEEVLVEMGEWIRLNTAEDAVVATPDIGAIGYVSRRRVLDLGGLVSPEINRMRSRIDVERIISEGLYLKFGPDYMLDRSEVGSRFAWKVIAGVRFEPVKTGIVPNLGIRKLRPFLYTLYRLERMEGTVEDEDWRSQN